MKNRPTSVKKAPVHPAATKAGKSDPGWWLLCLVLLMVLVAYLPVFQAGFVSWDDDDYIVKNQAIRSFSHMKELITVPVQGNYHPLTMLSLAMNFALSGL